MIALHKLTLQKQFSPIYKDQVAKYLSYSHGDESDDDIGTHQT